MHVNQSGRAMSSYLPSHRHSKRSTRHEKLTFILRQKP